MLTALTSSGWIQLHTGAPGDSGTANVSSETTRKTFAINTPSGGATAGTGSLVSWAPISLSGTENLTHYSVWTLGSGGVCHSIGALTTPRNGVNNGDTVNFTPSDFTFAINDPA
jgi:hypothetical protein